MSGRNVGVFPKTLSRAARLPEGTVSDHWSCGEPVERQFVSVTLFACSVIAVPMTLAPPEEMEMDPTPGRSSLQVVAVTMTFAGFEIWPVVLCGMTRD